MLSAALEMYAMDKETSLETLDQKQLKAERYLADELVCPNEGKYSLNKEGEVVCSTHGTIKNPVKIESVISKANIPEQYRPFETLRLKVSMSQAEAALKLNDKNLVEQWVAIGKQQLLAIRNMAQNQMGQLPEAERQKGLKMLDAVKINQEDLWLKVTVEGLDEKTILSGITGFAGAVSAIALPNFQHARAQARARACQANRRVLSAATEMYEMDTGKTCSKLEIETLVAGKYLKTAPECPDGGTYSLVREDNGFKIECSHHKQN
jgi:competence protein ComGC